MSLLKITYNEDEMYKSLRDVLLPDEQILAAVYVSYQQMGFLTSHGVEAGYLALTDCNRLVGVRHGLLQSALFSMYLGTEKSLKVKKGLFGSRTVELDTGESKLRIAIAPKLGSGTDLPHQAEHFQTIMEVLEARQAMQ